MTIVINPPAEHVILDSPVEVIADAIEQPTPSFERLIADHQVWIRSLVHRLLGWTGDVDDVVQDVFVAALHGLPRFRGQSDCKTWLTRIAVNQCRSQGRRRLLKLNWLAYWRGQVTESYSAASPAVEQETAAEVRAAVGKLRQRDREVIVLHYLEELSVAQIATALQLKRNAVEVRLSRARDRLRDLLEPPKRK